MSEIDSGGPAFPFQDTYMPGLSKREYFAGKGE